MSKKDLEKPKQNLKPPVLEMVRVHTEKFRCLAYRDAEGRWWDKSHNPITEKVLSWEKL